MVDVFKAYQLGAEIIAASIRHPRHCIAAAKAGAHIATVPYKVLEQMMKHPLTDLGIARFMEDWQSVQKEQQ
jgi:transaldolase